MGVLFSDKVTLPSAIAPQPRLYTLILGESADDRKSTAIKMTLKFFRESLTDFPVCYGVGSAEGLAEQFKQSHRLLLTFDEFKTFVAKAKIETSVLLPAVNILFEDNRYQSSTKKHSINLKDVHLALLAASTVDTYSNIFDSQFLDIGFLNRLFVVKDHGHKRWAIPPKIDLQERDTLKRQLGETLKMVKDLSKGGPVELGLTVDAGERFEEWYHDLPQTQTAKRLDVYGHRLMLLLAVNDGKFEIDLETIERTIALLDYEYQIRQEVDPINADSKIAVMEERLRRSLSSKGGMDVTALKRKVHYSQHGLFVFTTALNNLRKAKEIELDRKTGIYRLTT
jgi:hypothetical protein